ncbi:MAG: WYL domain-containing protein [Bacteroidetes bacterium]|nr:WYL domain-containing protein [Bacteroidota bacterium]
MNLSTNGINVGDIVALKSNPLFEGLSSIIMSGECETLSPLMVITETVPTRGQKNGLNTLECNCLWYSHKSWQFEEAWLSSDLLKVVQTVDDSTYEEEEWKTGTLVSLSTLEIELGKRKSFLKYEGNNAEDKQGRSTIHHFHSFLSPVMHVLEVRKNVPNSRSGKSKPNPNKKISEWIVKCKWFNADTEKMSEAFIPLVALTVIPTPDVAHLRQIDEAIKRKSVYFIPDQGIPACFQPLDIIYRCGHYFIRAYDYIQNKVVETKPESLIDPLDDLVLYVAPVFDLTDSDEKTTYEILQDERLKCIDNAEAANSYLRIKYQNKWGNTEWRTVSDYEVISLSEDEGRAQYLRGFCHTRNEERTFRIDRILKMQQLSITFGTAAETVVETSTSEMAV